MGEIGKLLHFSSALTLFLYSTSFEGECLLQINVRRNSAEFWNCTVETLERLCSSRKPLDDGNVLRRQAACVQPFAAFPDSSMARHKDQSLLLVFRYSWDFQFGKQLLIEFGIHHDLVDDYFFRRNGSIPET